MTRDIFVPGIGQYENIGDIILRRQLMLWLQSLGRLHVYVGRAPEGYAEGLALRDTDVVYDAYRDWYRAGLARAWRGTGHYVFKPGEIQLSLAGLKEHVSMLPLACLVRLRRGAVLRVGAGTRNLARWPRWLMLPSVLVADAVWWRDPVTAAYIGHGRVMPDLAFGEGADDVAAGSGPRDLLLVSMRGDRPPPPAPWLDAVRRFAAAHGLRIRTATQVVRDDERSAALAQALGGENGPWDGTDHAAQEQLLRAQYDRARVVVSDRLHVLIAAYTHGAVPIGPLCGASDKIERHFRAAGLDGIAFDTTGWPADEIEQRLQLALARGPQWIAELPRIRSELAAVRDAVGAVFSAKAAAGR